MDSSHEMLCKMGCGFFGNQMHDGMCSKCHKDKIQCQKGRADEKQNFGNAGGGLAKLNPLTTQPTTEMPSSGILTTPKDIDSPSDSSSNSSSNIITSFDDSSSPSRDNSLDNVGIIQNSTKKKNRCSTCKKKVGLTGCKCRCGDLFCAIHRYSDKHDCSFDYKTDGRKRIAQANPVVIGEKIKRI